jgi:Tfp pilus assembly protein FimT
MIIIVAIAVMSTMSYRWLLQKDALMLSMDQIKLAIMTARQQAILHQENIIYCASADQQHCAMNWDLGQIILQQQHVIHFYSPLLKSIHCQWRSSFNKNNQIIFTRDGTTNGQQGRFEFIDTRQRILAKLIVNHYGRVREEVVARSS